MRSLLFLFIVLLQSGGGLAQTNNIEIGAFVASLEGSWTESGRRLVAGQSVPPGTRLVADPEGRNTARIRLFLPFGGELSNCGTKKVDDCALEVLVPKLTKTSVPLLIRLTQAYRRIARGQVARADMTIAIGRLEGGRAAQRPLAVDDSWLDVARSMNSPVLVAASIADLTPLLPAVASLKTPERLQVDLLVYSPTLNNGAAVRQSCSVGRAGPIGCSEPISEGVVATESRIVVLVSANRLSVAATFVKEFNDATLNWTNEGGALSQLMMATAFTIADELR
jgi:hypothetical protein